jgi:alpha-galactosidase
VVAPGQSRALFSVASMAQSEVVSVGRVRLPGLAAQRRYRVEPVLVGTAPSGLRAPAWWEQGAVLSGAALASAGVRAPSLHPEHAVLIRVTAVD